MFGLSTGHLLIVLVIILLFNARRLPELGDAFGKGLRAFKNGMDGKDHAQLKQGEHEDDHDPQSRA
jgi:sec-independent protein translocase protein TatA